MNATTYTIESVHGIKQTVVLVPTGKRPEGQESQAKPVPTPQPRDQQERLRSSK